MEKQQVMLDDTSTTNLDEKWTENIIEDFLSQEIKERGKDVDGEMMA